MVSALVDDEEPSNEEELSESGSSGPGTSERVFLATQTSRVNTPEVVLGMTERLFLPEGHVRVTGACLLFGLQRGSERGERGVVVADELSEEVFDEV